MATFSDIQLREVFHLHFLERLLKVTDPALFVLKGGVNLRFFLNSPRYSEDMDLDILGGAPVTLRKNVYKILEDASFRRSLATYGITDLNLNDPAKAKQTETTQRFKLRLQKTTGEELPTKVEFSRRESRQESRNDAFSISEMVSPQITAQFNRLPFRCQHYAGPQAVIQKIRALAGRPATQARDVFDLYILYLGNHFNQSLWPADDDLFAKARERLLSISYEQYRDQVVSYLSRETTASYGQKDQWQVLQKKILEQLS
jgi:predicted nucleotidyltransferase component of viral defense system